MHYNCCSQLKLPDAYVDSNAAKYRAIASGDLSALLATEQSAADVQFTLAQVTNPHPHRRHHHSVAILSLLLLPLHDNIISRKCLFSQRCVAARFPMYGLMCWWRKGVAFVVCTADTIPIAKSHNQHPLF